MTKNRIFRRENARFFLYAFLLLLLYVLETTVFQQLRIFSAKPELVLGALCCIAMRETPLVAGGFGLFSGILIDASRFHPPGVSMMLLVLLSMTVSVLFESLFRKTFLNVLLLFSAVDLLHSLSSSFFYILIWEKTFPAGNYAAFLAFEVLYGCFLLAPGYFFVKVVDSFFKEATA